MNQLRHQLGTNHMVTSSLNFYVLFFICYWRLWTSIFEFYGVLRVMNTVFWSKKNYCIHNWLILFEKEIYFCASFVLHYCVFYKDWVFVFFFNPWINVYSIITISFLVNVFSFWMVQLHFESINVCGLVSLVVSSFQALLINYLSFCKDFVIRCYYYYYYYYWCCHMYKLSLWFVFYHTHNVF